jgi:hypothetical protein
MELIEPVAKDVRQARPHAVGAPGTVLG